MIATIARLLLDTNDGAELQPSCWQQYVIVLQASETGRLNGHFNYEIVNDDDSCFSRWLRTRSLWIFTKFWALIFVYFICFLFDWLVLLDKWLFCYTGNLEQRYFCILILLDSYIFVYLYNLHVYIFFIGF